MLISKPAMISSSANQRNLDIFSFRIKYPSKALNGKLNCRKDCTKLTLLT